MAVADRPHQPLGLRPSDHDLITFVLRPMVSSGRQQQGFDAGGGFVHLADVYSVSPDRLTQRYAPAPGSTSWYFICPARCRRGSAAAGALGEGRWNSETGGEVVSPVRGADGRRVGRSRTLSYYSYGGARTTTTPWTTVTRHGWRMVELALDDDDEHGGGGVGGGDFVLCKLFRSPHNKVAVPALLFNCKRKAVGDHTEAPPNVRQQLVVQHSF